MDEFIRAHAADLRKGRWSASQQIYHITTCTHQRLPIFDEFWNARCLVRILRTEYQREQCETLAYMIMPDHLHWLLQLQEGNLSAIVGRVKSISSRRIGRPIWQQGFHDHAIRVEEDLRDVARYIIYNPVRAGLVEKIGDYPHWDVIWL